MNKLFFIVTILLAIATNSQAQSFTFAELQNWWGGKTAETSVPTLTAGSRLEAGQELKTANDEYKLIMQTDANLCIYNKRGTPTWCTMTNGKGADCYLLMQADGNLVIYNQRNQAIWASNTWNLSTKPVKMTLENDGSIHLIDTENTSVWSKK